DITDPLLALPAGSYQLTVTGATGTYKFALLNFMNAAVFAPGTMVSNTLSPANSTVFYQFNGNAGDRYYFNGQPTTGFSQTPYCRLYAPLGNIVMSQSINGDVDTFTLPQSGTYTLTVAGRVYDTTARCSYAFH